MAYAIVALLKAGHAAEARAALDGLLNARPVGKLNDEAGGLDYQVSTVRYFGDGSEENDHSGFAEPNLEFDSWGLALWAMGEYLRTTGDRAWLDRATYRGRVYDTIRDFVVRPLLANLEPFGRGLIVAADSSVWEQNDAPRLHYAASTIAAIAGLQRFVDLARAAGDAAAEREVEEKIALLRAGLRDAFVRDGHLVGTLEPSPRNEVDGSVLEAMNFGLLENVRVSDATLARMARLKVRSGGFRRVTGSSHYERQEFLFVNFNFARALLRRGKLAEAETIVHRMRQAAAGDAHVFPEMYLSEPDPDADPDSDYAGEIGRPIGARPMVGYGAGAYLLYLAERQELVGSACSSASVLPPP
jgi:GH15 family glucan-1,4-alpha-glucosidase